MAETISADGPRAAPLADADDVCRLDARQLALAYASGSLSPVEVIHSALKRAEVVQARFNAFTRLDPEGALEAARLSEQRWRRNAPLSPADGVPTTIKDILWVKGWPVSFGSNTVDDLACATDAPAVALLRQNGAIFFAQSTTPEFGWKAVTDSPRWGITRNPWDAAKTPGGSSGGAAVAAATGAGVFHIGTDGGGSIRIPAAFTGIVGLKPTFGRVPAYPPSAFGTVAHIGPMTRTVEDTEAMFRAMSGRDLRDWTQPAAITPLEASKCDIRKMKIGFWSRPPIGSVDAEIASQVQGVAAYFSNMGADVELVDLPDADYQQIFRAHWYAGATNRLSMIPQNKWAELDQGFIEIAELGARLTVLDYVQAQWPHWTDWASFSFPINLSQQPACVIPCGFTVSGLPIGLQIVGARGAEGMVLQTAKAIEGILSDPF